MRPIGVQLPVQWCPETNASPYWIYGGKPECSYMMYNHRRIVELVAMEICHKYPDRPDRRLSIGDSSTLVGSCAGHMGSHAGCIVTDINYYTLGKNNTTQYRPGKPGDSCHELTYIWNEDGCDWPGNSPGRLLRDVIDWERNYYLVMRLKDFFPETEFITNWVIKDYIASEVKKKYGLAAERKFVGVIGADENPARRHSHHMHFYMGYRITYIN